MRLWSFHRSFHRTKTQRKYLHIVGLSAVGMWENNRNLQESTESTPTQMVLRYRCYGRQPQSLFECPGKDICCHQKHTSISSRYQPAHSKKLNLHHSFPRLFIHSWKSLPNSPLDDCVLINTLTRTSSSVSSEWVLAQETVGTQTQTAPVIFWSMVFPWEYSAVGVLTEWPGPDMSCHKQLLSVVPTKSPKKKKEKRRGDAGPGRVKADLLFTSILCLHKNTIILTDLGQWE